MPNDAIACVAKVARASHGKLIAILVSTSRDIASAQDAVANAYRAALEVWPVRGIPQQPEAWLLTCARNSLIDKSRSAGHRTSISIHHGNGDAMEFEAPVDENEFPDERLKLMFIAAHPAIDHSLRAPLILQTVLGLEAAEIGRMFFVAPATMAQRLVRAKNKIRDAGISFCIPHREQWDERLEDVLEAIYGVYCVDQAEALYLADLIAALLPNEPEALGLAAVIAFSASRTGERFSKDGRFVPLEAQDPHRWDKALMMSASSMLLKASSFGRVGRFQLEAAIHEVHADRLRTGTTDWHAIVQLYDGLVAIAPTRGVCVARAYAISKVAGVEEAIQALSFLKPAEIEQFVPALLCRAHLREQGGELAAAVSDLTQALSLVPKDRTRERQHLESDVLRVTQQAQPHAA